MLCITWAVIAPGTDIWIFVMHFIWTWVFKSQIYLMWHSSVSEEDISLCPFCYALNWCPVALASYSAQFNKAWTLCIFSHTVINDRTPGHPCWDYDNFCKPQFHAQAFPHLCIIRDVPDLYSFFLLLVFFELLQCLVLVIWLYSLHLVSYKFHQVHWLTF